MLRRLFSKEESAIPTASELPADTVTIRPPENAQETLSHKPQALKNPVILVNGLARDAHEWDKLVPWLTSNPDNTFGGVYQAGKDAKFQARLRENPDAKVFALDPSNNLASPRVLAGEIRRMIDHLVRETGAQQVDVVGHSQGGLNTLAALDQGEDQIGKVVSIATPWKGAAIASLARTFDGMAGRKFESVLAPLGKDQGALMDIRPLHKNEWLRDATEHSKDRADFYSITGSGTPTIGAGDEGQVVAGDGFVTIDSGLGMPGAKNYHLRPGDWKPGDEAFRAFSLMDVNHLGVAGNSATFQTLENILTQATVKPQPALVRTPANTDSERVEYILDDGEDQIHDHLRAHTSEPFSSWTPLLDQTQDLRQSVVETELDLRAADLRQSRAKLTTGLAVAAGVAGAALLGPLALVPGVVGAGLGVTRYLQGRREEKKAETNLRQSLTEAQTLNSEIETRLKGT